MSYHQRYFGPRREIAPELDAAFASEIPAETRSGDVTIRLARAYGFCFGVERAVRLAFEARRQFPDRKIYITSEIVHNPSVNRELRERGIEYLNGHVPTSKDVVILPAFGAAVGAIERIRATGATIVDTTCGAVINVWNKVSWYAARGVTSVIHGKVGHEESVATASRAGAYAIVRNVKEAHILADFILGASGPFPLPCSAGFDPARDLGRIGLANQTTMLASESLDIQRVLREAMERVHGDVSDRFFSFDTICSATQERQDAVRELIESGIDVLVVVGGANSSNTGHLVELGRRRGLPTHHVTDSVDVERIVYKRPIVIGLTAGASTPSSELRRVISVLDVHEERRVNKTDGQ